MNNLHLYIQPQLDSIIDELISAGLTLSELTEPLVKPDWHRELPYRDMKIRFNQAFLTIGDWKALHGLIQGDYRPFNAILLLQLSTTIEARWEIKQRHEQEDYMANYQYELQGVVGL